jgi:hypothetical protein
MGRQIMHCTRPLAAAALLMAAIVFAGQAALACGYHDPRSMARGLMNLVFPKSLYVSTAVWRAQRSGVLPPRQRKAAKDLFAYQRDVSNLQKLGARLVAPSREEGSFALVLLDSMLWTRFVSGPDGYTVATHVKGPEKGDAVLVTESAVIKALLDGSIDMPAVEAKGLFRLYGPVERQAATRNALRGLSTKSPAASLEKAG